MAEIRRQLTLFISDKNETIESIRAEFNPEQYKLIPAHVTLCREDEVAFIDKVIENIKSVSLAKPIHIEFGKIRMALGGNGVFLPSKGENKEFHELRKTILKGLIEQPRNHEPHITLMHPRNSICTAELFDKMAEYAFPTKLDFNKVSLIEQKAGGKWNTIHEYIFTEKQELTKPKKH